MKGDFTRFTFRPDKHYTSVLMQQGRLQLDSDWNEQVSIQAHLNQIQVQDMVGGAAGTPGGESKDGFKVVPTPNGTDLVIKPGSFYVGGLLCELLAGTTFSGIYIERSPDAQSNDQSNSQSNGQSTATVQVPFLAIDGQPFEKNQWLEVPSSEQLLSIEAVNPVQKTLKLVSPSGSFPSADGTQELQLRRVRTYATQPDYPNPTALETDKTYLVYLDVWQRHITAIEDPDIREIALTDIPDTTTRSKTIWQVKLLPLGDATVEQIKSDDSLTVETSLEWQTLTNARPILLSATATGSQTGMSTSGLENQLYRVEIHRGGDLKTATLKWSRDNGTVVSAIKSISAQESAITLPRPSRDSLLSFKAGQWVEVTDDVRELNTRPGVLVRLQDVVMKAEEKLIFDPATATDTIDDINFPPQHNPKVRRWDQAIAALPTLATSASGIELENGICVTFTAAPETTAQSGDYWLIPTRMNPDQPIEWQRDSQGNPIPQPPLGIRHYFGILALTTSLDEQGITDKRLVFPPLINCFDKTGDVFRGSLGIGVEQPLAKLHVAGRPELKTGKVSVTSGSPTVTGTDKTKFKRDVQPGGQIILMDAVTGRTHSSTIIAVSNHQTLTVNPPFDMTLVDVPFLYQQPAVIRGDALTTLKDGTQTYQPQFLLTSQGNVGIGTGTPDTKLQVEGTVKVSTAQQSVQITQSSSQVNLETTSDGYHFNKGITVETGSLSAGMSPIAHPLSLKTSGIERLSISTSGNVQIYAPSKGTTLEVSGAAAASAAPSTAIFLVRLGGDSLFSVQPNGNSQIGSATTSRQLQVFGEVAIAKNPTTIPATPPNGLWVEGGIWANSTLQVKGKVAIGESDAASLTTTPNQGLLVNGPIFAKDNIGIAINPLSTTAKFHLNGTARLGDAGTFIEIVPPTLSEPQLQFTASSTAITGYAFDKALMVNASITAGGDITIGGGMTINSTVRIGTATNFIEINPPSPPEQQVHFKSSDATTGYVFDRGITLTNGQLKVSQGSLTIHAENISVDDQEIALKASGTERIKLSARGVDINTEDTVHPTDIALRINGQAVIGKDLIAKIDFPKDGLLVQGDVGIGVGTNNTSTLPDAKLEIAGTSVSDDFALKVRTGEAEQNNRSLLLGVKNNGVVIVGKHLRVNPPDKLRTGAENSQLYVEGKIFARDMTVDDVEAKQFRMLSSRTLKENVVELSSQDVDTILRDLNPVKFTYRADDTQTLHFGFIAEDVPTVLASPDQQAINPVEIVATLTKVVKDQRQAIALLGKLVKDQQQAIATLTEKVTLLETNPNRP